MATHLEDEEQLENIKRWFKENGAALLIGIAAALVVLGSWEGYSSWKDGRINAASQRFNELQAAMDAGDDEQVRTVSQVIIDDYPGSPYASAAQFMRASQAVNDGALTTAIEALQWVVTNGFDAPSQALAKLRLAQVYWQQGQLEMALNTLPTDEHYLGLAMDLQGDIQREQGNLDAAREAYTRALAVLDPFSPSREMIERKLADVGGGALGADAMAAAEAS